MTLAALSGKSGSLVDVVRTMAEITAWGHLRSCGRFGASSVEALADFAERVGSRNQLTKCAHASAALTLQQWQQYSADYMPTLIS